MEDNNVEVKGERSKRHLKVCGLLLSFYLQGGKAE